jgi:hypothetical protein
MFLKCDRDLIGTVLEKRVLNLLLYRNFVSDSNILKELYSEFAEVNYNIFIKIKFLTVA